MVSVNSSLDGAPVFSSSNTSIWPLVCTLNEIGPEQRRSRVMLVSLWFGVGKPKLMDEFLRPFVEESIISYNQGSTHVYEGKAVSKKCRVLNGISDSVARPLLRNSKQFNGKYGCGPCLHPGKNIKKGKGHTRVYPGAKNGYPFGEVLRKHDDTLVHAEQQLKGIKRKSILCEIPGFDIINNLDVNWMHAVALGVTRQIAKLWFKSNRIKLKKYDLSHSLGELDEIST